MKNLRKVFARKAYLVVIITIILLTLTGFSRKDKNLDSCCNNSFGDVALDDETYQKYLKPVDLGREDSLPEEYDARNDGIVTSAKDQGNCGSCWSFTSAGTMESHLLDAGFPFNPTDLSDQQQVSCNLTMSGCCGGSSSALRYWEDHGPIYETCFPYGESSTNGNCNTSNPTYRTVACDESSSCPQLNYRITNWHTVDPSEFLESLWVDGPSYFRYDFYDDFYGFWNDGHAGDVYVNEGGTLKGGHAVLIIGWDNEKDAFLIKNSWGPTNGPEGDGTFWMAYGGHQNDLYFQMANFDVYLFQITKPNDVDTIYAGSASTPQKIIINTNKPTSGLDKTDFKITIGSQIANIITLYEGSENYVFEVLPSSMPSNGTYDLEVEYVSASVSDVKEDSIVFADAANVDVDLVIDRSGSMSGTPLESAKQASSQFVDYMNYDDMVGVVSFSSSITTNYALTSIVDDSIKTAAKSAINSISATGSTSIGGGLQKAQEQLTTLGNSNHPWAIVLLSDGNENYSPYVADVLPDIVESKTVVHTVGLGSADQEQLLDIATQTGGTYNYAPTPEELAEIYSTISGAVSNQQTLLSETGTVESGTTDIKLVVVDSTVNEATFSISWSDSGSTIDLTLEKPDGTGITPSSAAGNDDIDFVSGSTYQYYRITKPTLTSGVWEMHVTDGAIISSHDKDSSIRGDRAITYTARVTANTSLTAQFYLDKDVYLTYEPIKLITSLSDTQPITNATVIATVTPPSGITQAIAESEWIEINSDTMPDPEVLSELASRAAKNRSTLLLYDDGQHGDGSANDGVYANTYNGASEPGSYTFSINAEGFSTTGEPFTRMAELSTYIAENPDPPPMYSTFLPLVLNNCDPNAFNIRPVLTGPADGAFLSTLIPTLEWEINNNLDLGSWFYYWISTDPNFGHYDISGWSSAFTGSTKPRWNLDPNTTYFWYAAYDYINSEGWWEIGPSSEIRSFTTGSGGTILPAPTLVSPPNGTTDIDTFPVTLDWEPVTGSLEYKVQLWWECNPPYWCYYESYTTASQLEYPWYYFDSDTYYEWVAIPRNDYAWGTPSTWWSFTTGTVSETSTERDQFGPYNLYIVTETGEHIPYKDFK